MTFELATAGRVLVGAGAAAELATAVGALGARVVLVVTGRNPQRVAPLLDGLTRQGLTVEPFPVTDEPTVDVARTGVRRVVETGAGAVVAIGGGSALDTGKAIAALAPGNRGAGADPLEHLEVVGAGRPLQAAPLPFVAVPTTAGTGSEVTRNAVLAVPGARVKASLRSPLMLPRLAIVDPDLLVGLPPAVLASSGLDALSQVIEPFLSSRANPITDALARDGIRRSARALEAAFTGGLSGERDGPLRSDLALASLCGGLCLANAGLGAVHGFAAPAGGMFAAPHGAVCAALLAPVLEVNLRALRARAASHPALPRLDELAALLTGAPDGDVHADDGIAFVARLTRALAIPGLGAHGLTPAEIPTLVAAAQRASSMKGNPLPLTEDELTEIAERAL